MRLAYWRMGLAVACGMLAGSCSPPPGIHRAAIFNGKIDVACVERSVRGTEGLTDVQSESYLDRPDVKSTPDRFNWIWVSYNAKGLNDVLDTLNVGLTVDHFGDPTQYRVTNGFDRNSDRAVLHSELQNAVNIMKRVEANIGAACGIDLVRAMQMYCGPSLNNCEGIV